MACWLITADLASDQDRDHLAGLARAAIALVAVSFLKVGQHFNDPLSLSVRAQVIQNLNGTGAVFVIYAKVMNQAQEAFYQALEGDLSRVDDAITGLESVPNFDQDLLS